MNNAVPKQFIELKGRPVLMHTIEKFSSTFPEISIVLVLAKELRADWDALVKKFNFNQELIITDGGETRYHSVKSGLEKVPDHCVVGIHDAARPLVSADTIRRTFEEASITGNASPAVALSDSIRVVKGKENTAVDRSKYRIIQTPQCFHSDLIKAAFKKEYKPEFTDDATVLEAYGEKINLVEGNKENIKITTAQDLIIAEVMI